jgi:hypothetical protein
MFHRIRRAKPSPAMVVAIAALALSGTGSAVAASGLITGRDVQNNSLHGADIANGSVRGYDVKNGSLNAVDLSERAKRSLRGATGPQGPAGAPGQSLAATRLTAVNQTYSTPQNEVRVVDVPALPLNSGGPSTSEGAELFEPVKLDAGTYKVDGVAQFFDFTADGEGAEYGVARVFLGDQVVGTLWTPDVPDDGNNGAQSNGTSVVQVPAGGATLSVRAAMRSSEADGGQAGGNLVVSRIAGS